MTTTTITTTSTTNDSGVVGEPQPDDVTQHIREEYRNLQQEIQEKSDADGTATFDLKELRKYVMKANETFTSVKRPREAVIDATILRTCGALVKHSIEKAQSGLVVFRPAQFAQKMSSYMMIEEEESTGIPREEHWNRLGSEADLLFNRAVCIENMYSALMFELPQAPLKQRRVKGDNEVAAKTQPTKVSVDDLDTKDESAEVVRVLGILKKTFRENKKIPVEYIRFIINPDKDMGYTYTIQNMFAVSFLVRDQHAKIMEDECGIPVILPTKATETAADERDAKQAILTLTPKEWREAVKIFNITSPMIPQDESNNNKRPNVEA